MKTKKTATLAALSVVTALFLFSPAALAASPALMQGAGIIVSAGNQSYSICGGNVVQGEVLGNPITSGASVNFHFDASVTGLSTSGSGQITVPASRVTGSHGAYVIKVGISDEFPAAVFPLNLDGSSCTSGCTSKIP